MAAPGNGYLWTYFYLVILGVLSSASTSNNRIGLLWDRKVISEVAHLRPSLDTIANISTGGNITVSYIDVTDKTPFQIYSLICNEIMEGTVGFISACSCYTGMSINSVIKDVQVPLIALETGCDYGDPTMSNVVYFPHTQLNIGRAVTQVISHVGWTNIVLLYDDQTAKKMDRVMETLSESNATVQAFRIQDPQSTGDIQDILDFVRDHYRHPVQFLVVCSLQCQQEILLQANLYGKMNNVQALYTFETQWLLLTEPSWLKDLQENSVGDIDNVASVVPMRATDKSSESLVEEAFTYLLQSTRTGLVSYTQASNNVTDTVTDVKSCNQSKELFRHLTSELQVLLSTSFTMENSGYQVYTAMRKGYKAATRVFEVVSHWTSQKPVSGNIFPNLMFGLNARHITIATLTYEPFVIQNSSAVNTTDEYYGLCIHMLEELSRTLNFTYSFTQPADGQWGAFKNGSWTGLTGMMHEKLADMVVAPLAATVLRSQAMDFTEPFYLEYTTVLVQLPDPEAKKWSLYISPFKWEVWLCIALSIPFIGMIIWLMTKFSPHYSPREIGRGLAKIDNAMLYALGSIFSQGGIHLPTAQSGRFVVGFWWMYCIVVVATYSGNLIAFLTVSIPTLPFNTLEEMVNTNDYKFGTQGGTAFLTAIESAKTGVLKEVHTKMEKFWRDDPSINSTVFDVHLNKAFNDKYGWIGDKTTFELLMSRHCNIDMIREEFIPMQYAVGLQNNSAYNTYISDGIKKIIEGGLINKWKQQYWPRQNFCSRGLVTEAKPVTLKDVQGAYYALGILVFFAACVLIVEKALRIRASYNQETETDLMKGSSSGGYMSNGYASNGYIPNGNTKGVSNGHSNGVANGVSNGIANGYSNGYSNGGHVDIYGREITPHVANGDVSDGKKKKKKKKDDGKSMESGAPVFSRSFWS